MFWIDGLGLCPGLFVGMRVSFRSILIKQGLQILTNANRIVEYATREQAQQAVTQLSNQNLMGRLVYVREVRLHYAFLCGRAILIRHYRTVKPSPDS